jgi:hypothetical protein
LYLIGENKPTDCCSRRPQNCHVPSIVFRLRMMACSPPLAAFSYCCCRASDGTLLTKAQCHPPECARMMEICIRNGRIVGGRVPKSGRSGRCTQPIQNDENARKEQVALSHAPQFDCKLVSNVPQASENFGARPTSVSHFIGCIRATSHSNSNNKHISSRRVCIIKNVLIFGCQTTL